MYSALFTQIFRKIKRWNLHKRLSTNTMRTKFEETNGMTQKAYVRFALP